ncbi:MAG: hypothetical protein AABX51_02435 [Nanoarchaeota archaeon]
MASVIGALPKEGKEFIFTQAQQVLQGSTTLEDILRNTVKVFSEKEYGWLEAIQSNTWFRYPHEVDKQRFCSEEALKNYLILQALGIPARYALVENYQDRGLAHELVIVPDGKRSFLLDWEYADKVTLSDHDFKLRNGQSRTFSALHYIPDEEVLERVEAMRNRSMFLDAIESGQHFFRSSTDDGQLDAYIKYDLKEQKVDMVFYWISATGGLPFYFKNTLAFDQTIQGIYEVGIARPGNLFRPEGATLMGSKELYPVGLWSSEYEWLNVGVQNQVFYHFMRKLKNGQSICNEEDHQAWLDAIKNPQTDDPTLLKIYEHLREYYGESKELSPRQAELFIDYQTFLTDPFVSDTEKVKEILEANLRTLAPFQIEYAFVIQNAKEMAQALPIAQLLEAQGRLSEALADKTGYVQWSGFLAGLTPFYFALVGESLEPGYLEANFISFLGVHHGRAMALPIGESIQ